MISTQNLVNFAPVENHSRFMKAKGNLDLDEFHVKMEWFTKGLSPVRRNVCYLLITINEFFLINNIFICAPTEIINQKSFIRFNYINRVHRVVI